MSEAGLGAEAIKALVERLGCGAHCIGERVLYIRRFDSRWSPATRVMIEHVIQEAIDYAVRSFTNVLQAEMRGVEQRLQSTALGEALRREKKVVRAAIQKERRRVKKLGGKRGNRWAHSIKKH